MESLQEITNVAPLPTSLVSTPVESLHYLSAQEAFLEPLPFILFHFLLHVHLQLFRGIHYAKADEGYRLILQAREVVSCLTETKKYLDLGFPLCQDFTFHFQPTSKK